MAGDALAAPTHWYYGGKGQVIGEYGHEISEYTKPNTKLAGSILNKSNLNGGGRSSSSWNTKQQQKSIIGDVINHGKQDLWSPNKSIHYHATLQKGENTLEVQLARVLMKSMVKQGGRFDADHFRQAYMDFMTTPNSHNDTYASTCHRMFFANLIHNQLPPDQCPDNDHHNVDTVDGLVLPTIVAMADPTAAAACAAVTRESKVLEGFSNQWGQLVHAALYEPDDAAFENIHLAHFAQESIRRLPNPNVSDAHTMSACYLSQSLPGLVDMTAKYLKPPQNPNHNTNVWHALLANANVGGENVHRGSILGAILGARAGVSQLPPQLMSGLYPHQELAAEIDDFVQAVLPPPSASSSATEEECERTTTATEQ